MSIQTNAAIAQRIADLLEAQGVEVENIEAFESGFALRAANEDDDIDPSGIGGGGEKGP